MSVGDQTSRGLTSFERAVPGGESDGPGATNVLPSVYEKRELADPVRDMPSDNTVYPNPTKDYVGRRDRLTGMIVPGDGEPPLDAIH
jgi:hypothetical protein